MLWVEELQFSKRCAGRTDVYSSTPTEENLERSSFKTKEVITKYGITVEPPNKGHIGGNNVIPCRGVVPMSEVKINNLK